MEHELGPLPEWSPDLEFSERAIDRFVYSNEPAGEMGQEFRVGLAAAIAEAVAAERERCARLVETQDKCGDYGVGCWFELLAEKIRVTPNDKQHG